jgi:hypothetical protein
MIARPLAKRACWPAGEVLFGLLPRERLPAHHSAESSAYHGVSAKTPEYLNGVQETATAAVRVLRQARLPVGGCLWAVLTKRKLDCVDPTALFAKESLCKPC